MSTYIEYDLGEGASILIEAPDDLVGGVVKAARGDGEVTRAKAKKTFVDALKDVRLQAKLLLNEIEELHASEAEIKFGINTIGELGNLAIGKIGVGVNYEVTLRWTKPTEQSKTGKK